MSRMVRFDLVTVFESQDVLHVRLIIHRVVVVAFVTVSKRLRFQITLACNRVAPVTVQFGRFMAAR